MLIITVFSAVTVEEEVEDEPASMVDILEITHKQNTLTVF